MKEMNASEPLMRRRKHYVMSKPNTTGKFGKNEKGMQVLFSWHPAYRRHEFHSGFFLQLRDPSSQMSIEKLQGQQCLRVKVERLCGGSDPFI